MLSKNCIGIIIKYFKNEKLKNKKKQCFFRCVSNTFFFAPCSKHLFKTVHPCFGQCKIKIFVTGFVNDIKFFAEATVENSEC